MNRSLLMLVALGTLALACGGCTKVVTYRAARCGPQTTEVVRGVPETSVYAVGYATGHGRYRAVPHTARLLERGTPVGFERDPADGTNYATAAGERMAVAAPAGKTLVWFSRQRVHTRLGKEIERGTEVVAQSAAVVAKSTAVAGLAVGAAALEAKAEECQEEHYSVRRHRQR